MRTFTVESKKAAAGRQLDPSGNAEQVSDAPHGCHADRGLRNDERAARYVGGHALTPKLHSRNDSR